MPRRILLVDDEPVNLALMEAILRPFECEFVRAADGVECLERLAAHPFDLVLLDRRMPRMDGLEALRRIRADTKRPWVPVILITADGDREARLGGLEAGADEFLEKPIDRALLVASVRTLLRLRAANDELAERARALEEIDRERRELIDFIVHDLKNPLSVMRANLSYVEKAGTGLDGEVREALLDAGAAARRMTGLVTDFLTIERMEQTGLDLRPAPFDLGAMVNEIARIHTREALMEGIHIEVHAADAPVLGDSGLLRRVVENLLENAVRHTPRDGRVELRMERAGPEAPLIMDVSNQGNPVPHELRDRLFSKFVRGEGGKGRFGLGLYFCQRVTQAHGGSLALREQPEWAVSFRLTLPLAVTP